MPNYKKGTKEFDPNNPSIETTVYTYHAEKKTLFNMYAFTYHDSYQKHGHGGEFKSSLDTHSFKIPSLTLKNVEIRNMLNDYQSLIYVEKDNYVI